MITSQTQFLPDIASSDPISRRNLAYLQARTRNLLFEFVLNKFLEAEKKGLTKAALARRIHHSPAVVTRWLGSPTNWRSNTVSDLLAGIAGEELRPDSVPVDGHPKRNFQEPEWLREEPLVDVKQETTAPPRPPRLGGLPPEQWVA